MTILSRQSGFCNGYSTQDVLLHVSDSWLKAIDIGQLCGCHFLDLARAFDCVSHDILLQKLGHYGIRGGAYGWMNCFVSGRTREEMPIIYLCHR